MRNCRDCYHHCHCVEAEHVDEYGNLCECKKCTCKETKKTKVFLEEGI